jgi:hypothetical protein
MKKNYFLSLCLFIGLSFGAFAQNPVINEVDSDTPSTDVAEFIELKWTANTSLDGYIVVLFNGSSDTSYLTIDLTGKSTDANGFFIIANTPLINANDSDLGASNILQNGADAVALYQAASADFPNGTAVTTTNLIDAVVYDTNDSDDTGLLTGLGQTVQYNESENGDSANQSIQRKSDGTYATAAFTFRAENVFGDPCVLNLTTINTSCNTNTNEVDTYTTTIGFTGGGAGITYTITAKDGNSADVGSISGDNPNTVESGTIIITGVNEGINFTLNVKGGTGSSCDIDRNINAPTCLPAASCPAQGAVIITEIMQNPSFVGDDAGEYFEIYNTTNTPIDLKGWIIKTASTGSPVEHVIPTSLILPANGYLVLGENADINTNGGVTVNYQYDAALFLGNGTATITIECSQSVFDSVTYDDGATFPDPNGASMELATNKYSHTDNDSGVNWATATAEIISGGDKGTPGTVNSFVLSIIKNTIKGFATYPNPVTSDNVTITSNSAENKQVAIFNVLGKKVVSTHFTGTKSDINVANLASGIYILKVTEGTKTATSKLIIK